jgi:hypothetical protein
LKLVLTPDLLEIVSDFESRGFRPVAMRGLVSRLDRCFEFPRSSQELGKYVLLEHKPKLNSFSVSFCAANSEAKRRANSVLASLTSAQLPGIGVLRERLVSQPWLTTFNAAHRFSWPTLTVPNRLSRDGCGEVLRDLHSELFGPFDSAVRSTADYWVILLSDEAPYSWHYTHSAYRTIDAIAHGVLAGMSPQLIVDALLGLGVRIDSDWPESCTAQALRDLVLRLSRHAD